MIFPQIDSKKWAEMYDLKIKVVECPKCGMHQTVDRPVAFDHWRGLEAELHECGPNYQSCVFKTVDKERIKIWNELQNFLK